MRILKIMCIFFCLLFLAGALTGTHAIHWSTSGGLNVWKEAGVGPVLWSVSLALLYAYAAYGIHRKLPAVWKLGWVVFVFSALEFMIRATSSAVTQAGGWVACIGIIVGGIGIAFYWGVWWNRQRNYFCATADKK
jgi:hypothetical protein